MIRSARDRGIAVALIAVPAPGLTLAPLPLYSEIAAEFGLPGDLETVADILGDRALKSDYIHPNAAGYRRLALAIADLLRAGGAIPEPTSTAGRQLPSDPDQPCRQPCRRSCPEPDRAATCNPVFPCWEYQ